MQPIFEDAGLPFYLMDILPIVMLILCVALFAYAAYRDKFALAVFAMSLMLVAVIGAIGAKGIMKANLRAEVTEARLAEVETVYGVSLPEDAYLALEYPDERPETDSLQAFGTALITYRDGSGTLSQTQMTLIWEDGEFGLFSGEGAVTELEELPRVG